MDSDGNILLNDQELLDNQYYLDKHTESDILKGSRDVAKAQLRNVVKFMEDREKDDYSDYTDFSIEWMILRERLKESIK